MTTLTDDLIAALRRARGTLGNAIRANIEGATEDDVAQHVAILQIDAALARAEREKQAEPDMLAALKELATVTRRALSGDYDEDDTREALDDAERAIAKTEGRQP